MLAACYNPIEKHIEVSIMADDECLKAELEAILVTMSKDKRFISIVTETLNNVADLIEKEIQGIAEMSIIDNL